MTDAFIAEPLAEDALLLRFGNTIDAAINARVLAAAARLRASDLPGVREIAPAYASVMVGFDPFAFPGDGRNAHENVCAAVRESLRDLRPTEISIREIEIPVCYGGAHGPDTEDVARHAGMDAQQVIERHTASSYRVAMLGFAPGFPYLLGLDRALHTPRRQTPRIRVPAGSVAIGGAQTGIYPCRLPGGWMLIGRTPLGLFDARREPCCLLTPGDSVRFRAIDPDEFIAIEKLHR